MKSVKITLDEHPKIKKMFEFGATITEISFCFGVAFPTIKKIIFPEYRELCYSKTTEWYNKKYATDEKFRESERIRSRNNKRNHMARTRDHQKKLDRIRYLKKIKSKEMGN